jgi:hypothetical protein
VVGNTRRAKPVWSWKLPYKRLAVLVTRRGSNPPLSANSIMIDFGVLRKIVVVIALVAIIAMGIYPPWNQTYETKDGRFTLHEKTYGWLIKPPYPDDRGLSEAWKVELDLERLAVQWILVCIATGAALWITQRSGI